MNRTEYQAASRTQMPRPTLVMSRAGDRSDARGDAIWQQIRDAAAELAQREPLLRLRMHSLRLPQVTCANLRPSSLEGLA